MEYSRIVSVQSNTTVPAVSLEANLVKNTLPLSFPAKLLPNLAGTVMQRQIINNITALNSDIASLPAGMYLLQVKGTDSRETLKFVKQ